MSKAPELLTPTSIKLHSYEAMFKDHFKLYDNDCCCMAIALEKRQVKQERSTSQNVLLHIAVDYRVFWFYWNGWWCRWQGWMPMGEDDGRNSAGHMSWWESVIDDPTRMKRKMRHSTSGWQKSHDRWTWYSWKHICQMSTGNTIQREEVVWDSWGVWETISQHNWWMSLQQEVPC